MQSVTFSDKLKQVPTLQQMAEQASTYLDKIISPQSAPIVSAEWDRAEDDQGQQLVTLALKENGEAVTARFSANDFQDGWEVKHRIRSTWDDLLRIRIHKSLEHLKRLKDNAEE